MKFIIILLFAVLPFCIGDVSHLYATPTLNYVPPNDGYHYQKPSQHFDSGARPPAVYVPPAPPSPGYHYPKPQPPTNPPVVYIPPATKPPVIYIPPATKPPVVYIPPPAPPSPGYHYPKPQPPTNPSVIYIPPAAPSSPGYHYPKPQPPTKPPVVYIPPAPAYVPPSDHHQEHHQVRPIHPIPDNIYIPPNNQQGYDYPRPKQLFEILDPRLIFRS